MWPHVLDQQRVTEALDGALARDRVAHAYLFHGPDGVGKRAVALSFARRLQCPHAAEPGHDEAGCTICSRVRRLIHPDVHFLFPYPTDADAADIAARLARLGEDPYAAVDYVRRPSLADPTKTSNKQAFYPVARINEEIRREMGFKPVEGRYKIAILTDAEGLRAEAANAFLKLLEEPPPQTVFILTTSRPDRLLPTILSRCQRFRFDLLPDEVVEAALREREGVDPERAAMLARMADGSYTRALDLVENEDLMEDRALVIDFFRFAYVLHVDRLADIVERLAGMGRERVKGALGLMLRWLRDLVLFRAMGAEAPLVNVDQRAAVQKFCENVPEADLAAMAGFVEQAVELAERNVHLGLCLSTLAHALHAAMHGRAPEALYTPLTLPRALAS